MDHSTCQVFILEHTRRSASISEPSGYSDYGSTTFQSGSARTSSIEELEVCTPIDSWGAEQRRAAIAFIERINSGFGRPSAEILEDMEAAGRLAQRSVAPLPFVPDPKESVRNPPRTLPDSRINNTTTNEGQLCILSNEPIMCIIPPSSDVVANSNPPRYNGGGEEQPIAADGAAAPADVSEGRRRKFRNTAKKIVSTISNSIGLKRMISWLSNPQFRRYRKAGDPQISSG